MEEKDLTYLKNNVLTETEYVPEWRKKMTSPDYYAVRKHEYSLFFWITSDESGFKMDILVDTDNISKYNNHPLWIYFFNGYDKNNSKVIPVVVSKNPYMPYPVNLKITQQEYNEFIDFIKTCRTGLKMVANKKIDIIDLLNTYYFSKFSKNYHINEGNVYIDNQIYALNEMPTYSQDVTGLPFEIWIDTTKSFMNSGHSNSYRLKFQYPENNKDFNTWPTMLIPSKEIRNNKKQIPSKIINSLSVFVDVNKDLLLKTAKGEVKATDFKTLVTKVDKDGNIIIPYTAKKVFPEDEFGFQIIQNNIDDLYSIYDVKHQTMITSKWFKKIGKFKKHGKEIYAYATDEHDNQYVIFSSGVIKRVQY